MSATLTEAPQSLGSDETKVPGTGVGKLTYTPLVGSMPAFQLVPTSQLLSVAPVQVKVAAPTSRSSIRSPLRSMRGTLLSEPNRSFAASPAITTGAVAYFRLEEP